MRMSELAAAAALSDSAMTRIVDRLASDGLVERVRFDQDTRVVLAVLTDAGLRRLRHAYPTHLAGVRRYVIDHLGGVFFGALSRGFDHLRGAPGTGGGGPPGAPAPPHSSTPPTPSP